jgi:hypothetical protein
MKTLKGLLKSRVFWFNTVTGTLEIVNLLNGSVIPAGAASTIIVVGNIALRFLTNKALADK